MLKAKLREPDCLFVWLCIKYVNPDRMMDDLWLLTQWLLHPLLLVLQQSVLTLWLPPCVAD
jgi:hypothetical protein